MSGRLSVLGFFHRSTPSHMCCFTLWLNPVSAVSSTLVSRGPGAVMEGGGDGGRQRRDENSVRVTNLSGERVFRGEGRGGEGLWLRDGSWNRDEEN